MKEIKLNDISHPLDPLTSEEINLVTSIVKNKSNLGKFLLFETITLIEPPKNQVISFSLGDEIRRKAFVVALNYKEEKLYELDIDISNEKILRCDHKPGVQPAFIFGDLEMDFNEWESKMKHDPLVVDALKKRGIDDPDLLQIDPWPIANFGKKEEEGKRLAIGRCWIRKEPGDNAYARPIEGLSIILDLNKNEVVEIQDFGKVPIPPNDGNYSQKYQKEFRKDLKPIEITQPEGPSFTVDRNEVKWQKWHLRVGFTNREGLVIHNVSYEDNGKIRPILYRASLSEMIVPYGDPTNDHYKKQVFDAGEVGIGKCANSLELGCDCLGEIYYFDASLFDIRGDAKVIKNAICMHEEDYGILWKHTDTRSGEVETRRSRRLVISSIVTVGNYEYGFFWYFYQDGGIEYEIKLTGIVNSAAVPPGIKPNHGTLVAPQVVAHNHQHFFNVRLDMMVDGKENSVYEVDTVLDPIGDENPHGNAFSTKKTLIENEQDGARTIDPFAARYWTVVNSKKKNYMGEPVSYKISPGENVLPFSHSDSVVNKRAGFMNKHLWVTQFNEKELYASGDYPQQHSGGDGLPKWIKSKRDVKDKDLVVWYTLGHNHIPRLEDWPVMPVAYIGFTIKPSGFFDRNPALDVPPSSDNSCQNNCDCCG
ncbi:MAG: primary-amine oxidase [SAR202 cluster bacterium]|nr:primary-amine oxidase [SAR202 cluster bacterium]MQG43732.1 primary-amine oxidase [SAR202 cluster bacterium]